ncbi:D-amino acid dehydrogenase 1 [Candidatus Kinetoplastibacterium sorsogonicusi]|uniref:D-amino acid dehydrogenase 1 n=1 Tax=Candidatus Kinetoplastidibacterium kentomonadis TaxID=1576550 RepID=A0A3Q8F3M5_9PROT|nr:D-amino acid dehydrogenase [Candidatus Kinetoplastibacterium sorsogonicusi]AWD32503.1 D-amino acid dehydrogenase 1 [Candidatus Kinetoplastibacterium sorsogonicusi]
MKITVLGSGIQGICSAWWLTKLGHEVTVIDKCSSAALETSFANGGQISVSYAEPWSHYKNIYKIVKWLFQSDSPLSFKAKLDINQWKWIFSFFKECLPSNFEHNLSSMIKLAHYSKITLDELNNELDINYQKSKCGIIRLYSNQNDLEQAKKFIKIMNSLGVNREIISKEHILNLEPNLKSYINCIIGGDYTSSDESGNAFLFTKNLAELCKQNGCKFLYNTNINQLIIKNNKVEKIELIKDDGYYDYIYSDAYVVALGSYSSILLRPIGINYNIYPVKGYSATFNIVNDQLAPKISLIDNNNKLVISRLNDKLRIAGFVELSGYSRSLNMKKCQMITNLANKFFPDALDIKKVHYWAGLRPATPSGVPYIGKTKFCNLYINSGHGPLGWTMGIGSSKALADIINGNKPVIDFPFLG